MKRIFVLLFLCFYALSFGQSIRGQYKYDTKRTFVVNFSNSSIDSVLDFYTQNTGITIVKHPDIRTRIHISSINQINIEEAYSLLFTSLSLSGIKVEFYPNYILLVPSRFEPLVSQENTDTYVRCYQLKYANAFAIAFGLNDIYSSRQRNPFVVGPTGTTFYPTQNYFRATNDPHSNTLIINTTAPIHREVEQIMSVIDRNTTSKVVTKVLPLRYSSASDISVITRNVFAHFRTQSFVVNVDTRTNSLIIVCEERYYSDIVSVVSYVDQPVERVNTVWIHQLRSGSAQDITIIINQITRP